MKTIIRFSSLLMMLASFSVYASYPDVSGEKNWSHTATMTNCTAVKPMYQYIADQYEGFSFTQNGTGSVTQSGNILTRNGTKNMYLPDDLGVYHSGNLYFGTTLN